MNQANLERLMSASSCMTADEMKKFIIMLANSSYIRYWLNMHKLSDWQTVMGFQIIDVDGKPIEILGMESYGFVKDSNNFYLIKRCNEDRTPFTL